MYLGKVKNPPLLSIVHVSKHALQSGLNMREARPTRVVALAAVVPNAPQEVKLAQKAL